MKKFGLIALLALAGCAAPATESQTTAEQPSSNETASANSRTLSGIVEEPVVIDSEGDVTVTLEDADVDSITIQNAKSATIVLKSDSIVRSATGGSSSEEDAKAAIYADCPLVLREKDRWRSRARPIMACFPKTRSQLSRGRTPFRAPMTASRERMA